MFWRYEKLDENGRMQYCPANDPTGEVTGHIVMGVKCWFDENPEERKRLGWVKHLYFESSDEFKETYPDFDPALQYAVPTTRNIDEYTIQDEFHFVDKPDEMLELEEMLETMNLYVPSGFVQLDGHGGVLV